MNETAMQARPPAALAEQLRAVKPYLARLLPDPSRFAATMMVLARRTPEILRCDPASVVGAALVCAQLDLEPGPAEHVWLIPRRNRKTGTIDCSLLVGYKGMKALAERHPAIASVRTGTVFERDEFEHVAQPPSIRHVPARDPDRGEPVYWYAVAHRADGDSPHVAVLSRDDVEARRAHSASRDAGPWVTHYDQMARKSAIRALWAELPSSLDMARAAWVDDGPARITPADLGVGAAPQQIAGRPVDEETGEVLAEPEAVEPIDVGDQPVQDW